MAIYVRESDFGPGDLLKKWGIKQRAKPHELEGLEQLAFIDWIRLEELRHAVLRLLYAVPNGGKRDYRVAKKLRRQGVRAGVLDLCLPAARRGYHSLYIEMKYGKNDLTELQAEYAERLKNEGNCVAVAYDADQAKEVIKWYIGIHDNKPDAVIN